MISHRNIFSSIIVLLKILQTIKFKWNLEKCVLQCLITIKSQIVTQNHWTSFLRNAIKVSVGWNFRIPLTPHQLPSTDWNIHWNRRKRTFTFINGPLISYLCSSFILDPWEFYWNVLLSCPKVFTTPDGCPLFTSLSVATRDIRERREKSHQQSMWRESSGEERWRPRGRGRQVPALGRGRGEEGQVQHWSY